MAKDDGNSWFQLAMILVTMAGLLFVAAGFSYVPLSESQKLTVSVFETCEKKVYYDDPKINKSSEEYANLVDSCFENINGVNGYGKEREKSKNLGDIFIVYALGFAIFSLISWLAGKIKINKRHFDIPWSEILGYSVFIITFSLICILFFAVKNVL